IFREKAKRPPTADINTDVTVFGPGTFTTEIENHLDISVALRSLQNRGTRTVGFGVVFQNPILRPPMLRRFGGPPIQIQSVINQDDTFIFGGKLLRIRVGAGEFLDADVAEVAFAAFGFKADVAFARVGSGTAGDFL